MSNIVNFPLKIIQPRDIQLDLFDYAERNVGKYNFLDLCDTNQTEVIKVLREFSFQAVLDIRNFPTFERPLYNHREFQNELKSMKILYLPIVYMKKMDAPYSSFKMYKAKFRCAIGRGPVLFLYDRVETESLELEKWTNLISKRFSQLFEAHPATFSFKRQH